MNVRWEVYSGLPPVLSIVLNTPVIRVIIHLILQHNKSRYNKYYTHHSVALHGTDDVITNTMQRVQCETDIDNYEIKIKFIQEVNK